MQLERAGFPPPGLRLPQAKLSRKSNRVARGGFGGSNPYAQPARPSLTHTELGRAVPCLCQGPRQISLVSTSVFGAKAITATCVVWADYAQR